MEKYFQTANKQIALGKENLRLSEAALAKRTQQVEQLKESLRISEASLQERTQQVEQIKESLRLSEAALEKRTKQCLHDTLTNLPNRILFNDRLKQSMYLSNSNNSYAALLFMDINNFKSLNDNYGHIYGDAVLVEMSARLTSCIRDTDTAARIGGDEFVVILNNLHQKKSNARLQAANLAEKIRTTLFANYKLIIKCDNKKDFYIQHCCTVSIGLVLFKDEQLSVKELTDLADKAMYQAKNFGGGNRVQFIDSETDFLE